MESFEPFELHIVGIRHNRLKDGSRLRADQLGSAEEFFKNISFLETEHEGEFAVDAYWKDQRIGAIAKATLPTADDWAVIMENATSIDYLEVATNWSNEVVWIAIEVYVGD